MCVHSAIKEPERVYEASGDAPTAHLGVDAVHVQVL